MTSYLGILTSHSHVSGLREGFQKVQRKGRHDPRDTKKQYNVRETGGSRKESSESLARTNLSEEERHV